MPPNSLRISNYHLIYFRMWAFKHIIIMLCDFMSFDEWMNYELWGMVLTSWCWNLWHFSLLFFLSSSSYKVPTHNHKKWFIRISIFSFSVVCCRLTTSHLKVIISNEMLYSEAFFIKRRKICCWWWRRA